MNRRNFINNSSRLFGLAVAGSVLGKLPLFQNPESHDLIEANDDWGHVRQMFALDPDILFMSALLISSHPKPVREAIQEYRHKLDRENTPYFRKVNRRKLNLAREAAAGYLDTEAKNIALTDSTTTGLATIYNGLPLEKGDEVILGAGDYYSTYESLRLKVERSGARLIETGIYQDTEHASNEKLVEMVVSAITKNTRLVCLTWVHSGTGLKLPVAQITNAIKAINEKRSEKKQILVVVDGVHALGIEDFTIDGLGCDFFIAGCHKWLFGPRGTGFIWGNDKAWETVRPTIPSFLDPRGWSAWQNGEELPSTNAALMSPGGFKAYEHLWALPEAFAFHLNIGKKNIQERTHKLSSLLKEKLVEDENIQLRTPFSTDLSSGIVCFDVKDTDPWTVVEKLRERNIIASVTPYASRHVRLTPCIYNSVSEVETVAKALKEIIQKPQG